jgi:aspartate racemase
MKAIGLIGGMSWESSLEYYRIINETTRDRLGGLHSARVLMYSLDFAEIEPLQSTGRWDEAAMRLVLAARTLESGGADFIVLCTNTMHRVAEEVQSQVSIPLLHIADTTAERVKRAGIGCVGLLGTRYTMEEGFYRGRLARRHGLDVRVPGEEERRIVHDVIYEELCLGKVLPRSRDRYRQIIDRLVSAGAGGIILGCTEIGLLVREDDIAVPVFDTARIHAVAAAEAAL